jgi:hypothetical protein
MAGLAAELARLRDRVAALEEAKAVGVPGALEE